jgi:hypothetical protein
LRPELQSPLIQLQGSEFQCTESKTGVGGSVCVKGTYRERTVSIFQNSRAMSMTMEGGYDQAATPATKPAVSTVRDGFLVWRDLTALHDYVESIQIEERRGGCNPFAVGPGIGEPFSASYTIFWYSPDGRRTDIPFGTGYTKKCPAQILDLFTRVVRAGSSIRIP